MVVRISASAGEWPPLASNFTLMPSLRVTESLGTRQMRGAFDWRGADVPGLRPSTSHHPSGVVAVFDWPGLILPKMSSLLSRNELSLLVAARTRKAGAFPLF